MHQADAFVTAVLGPTNTGKTHYAIERMLSYKSGIIGFPLRLLARENYDKLVLKCGPHSVALLTGEEKIVPRAPKYWVCTVESMPLDVAAEFVAVDEIQLAADPDRGHIFTQRLMYARGLDETMFMGSNTIEGLLLRLVPQARIIKKQRFSKLSYVAPKKLSRIPKRSAVVAFSAQDVYATADIIRRHRGGAAVVLGALSPRTRNAQVEMFQSGEVDYLVATDAIGMGLNMDLDHVTFTKLSKFDGRKPRRLTAAEIGQIAGRAGRYTNDGTFCMTTELGDLDPDIVEAVETHRFAPLEQLMWRNVDLDFHDTARLLRSLDAPVPRPELARGREADDQRALRFLAKLESVRSLALGPAAVGILWDVCQVPDFHKTLTDSHVKLLSAIYTHLMGHYASIPEDWIAAQVLRLDNVQGDIDTLTSRLASIRTWTFISHRRDWLQNNSYWQDKTRQIEDRLSDALHQRLTLQFVDQRAAVLMKARDTASVAEIQDDSVSVDGQHVGQLVGLNFHPIEALGAKEARSFLSIAKQAMAEPVQQRLAAMMAPGKSEYRLTDEGHVLWRDGEIARLSQGDDRYLPKLKLVETNMIDQAQRDALVAHITTWLHRDIRQRLSTLTNLQKAELSGAAKGLAFQLVESFGCLPRDQALESVTLDKAARKQLKDLGVVFGRYAIWLGNLVKPRNRGLRVLLWSLAHDVPPTAQPHPATTYRMAEEGDNESLWRAMGFVSVGSGAERMQVRADILDNFANAAYSAGQKATPEQPAKASKIMRALMGNDEEALMALLRALSYRVLEPRPYETEEATPAARPEVGEPAEAVSLPESVDVQSVDVQVASAAGDETLQASEATAVETATVEARAEPEVTPEPVAEPVQAPEQTQEADEGAADAQMAVEAPAQTTAPDGEQAPQRRIIEFRLPKREFKRGGQERSQDADARRRTPGRGAGPRSSGRGDGAQKPEDGADMPRRQERQNQGRPNQGARSQGARNQGRPNRGRSDQQAKDADGQDLAAKDQRSKEGRSENRRPENRRPENRSTAGKQHRDGGAPGDGRRSRKAHQDTKNAARAFSQENKGQNQGRGRQADKAPDPDSPFAALAGLKQQLTKGR